MPGWAKNDVALSSGLGFMIRTSLLLLWVDLCSVSLGSTELGPSTIGGSTGDAGLIRGTTLSVVVPDGTSRAV